ENPGAAWGVFATASESFRLPFFIGVSLLAVVFIVYFYTKVDRSARLMQCSLALIMGGAIGNFIDRIRFNYVVDFIDWFYGARHWPTFNIADAAISAGVALMIISVLVEKEPGRTQEPEKAE
ncbi:MAG: signal peptidase II, partial [Myxococcota bacterium]